MCEPISLILSESEVFYPPIDRWEHSHTYIAERIGIPDGLYGDKYARVEVSPANAQILLENKKEKREIDEGWEVVLDESRQPSWWDADPEKHKDRALRAAQRWWNDCPRHIIPNLVNVGGDYSKNIGGNGSTNIGGNGSTNTGGNGSINTGGDYSINIGGNNSTNTGGDYSTNIGGLNSKNIGGDYSRNTCNYFSIVSGGKGSVLSVYWWDGYRPRLATGYVGECGILPNTKYKVENGKFIAIF